MIILTLHSFPSSTFPFSSLPRSISPLSIGPLITHRLLGFSAPASLLVPPRPPPCSFLLVYLGFRLRWWLPSQHFNPAYLPSYGFSTLFAHTTPLPYIPPLHVSSVLLLGHPSRFVLLNPFSRLLRSSCPMWSISRSSPLYPHIPPRHVSSVLLLGFSATPTPSRSVPSRIVLLCPLVHIGLLTIPLLAFPIPPFLPAFPSLSL